MKNKIIAILSGLLFISIVYIGYWHLYEKEYAYGNIEELNRGAEIDYDYINEMASFSKNQYELWQSCNSMLAKELKGDVSDSELNEFVANYSKSVERIEEQRINIQEMKQQRSEEFASFKYARVYNPDDKGN